MTTVDTLLTRAAVHTMDPHHPRASAVAIRGGRVVAVGDQDLADLAGPDTRVVELEGRSVLPGLTDCHIHFTWFALALQQVDLTGTDSLEEVLGRMAERIATAAPGKWVQGWGWDQERWIDRRFPSAADLDPVAPHHPVALTAKSGHAMVANSVALQRAGITATTPDPQGGRIERDVAGRPTGLLFEKAMDLLEEAIPAPDPDEFMDALPAAFERAWRVGLTAVHEMAMRVAVDRVAFDVYQRLRARGELGLRMVKYFRAEALDDALASGLRAGMGDDWLRVGGIKLYADGALGSRTAAMLEPYAGEPDNLGILVTEQQALEDLVRRATGGGLAVAIHTIGDRASRIVLDVLAATRPDAKSVCTAGVRPRIEHAQLLHPDDVGRLASLGIVASMQPTHATEDAPMADRYWGERCATAYAWRSLLDAGTVLVFGSDCPVEDLNPFLGIHAAVTRTRVDGSAGPEGWYPRQRLTVEEAVRAYTRAAADAAGLGERLGSLTAGKWADLVVLDRDVFTCDPAALAETRVVGTMIGGKWVYGGE